MYALVALLGLIATCAASCAPTPSTSARRGRWPVRLRASRSPRSLYTHNWALFFGAGDVPSPGSALLFAGARRRAPPRLCATACSASARSRCCTCRGCRRCSSRPRTPARRGRNAPGYEQISLDATRPAARPHRRSSCCWSAAGAGVVALWRGRGARWTPAGRAPALAVLRRRRRHRRCSPGPSSQLSPAWAKRYLAVAVPPFLLLAARRARRARRARHRRARDRGDAVAGTTRAAREEQRARRRRGDRAEPAPGRPRRLHAARAGAGAAPLPAAGAALRDADRAPCPDLGVTDWRDGVDRLKATSPRATSSRCSTRAARAAARAGQPIIFTLALARAVDRARAPALDRLGGVDAQ